MTRLGYGYLLSFLVQLAVVAAFLGDLLARPGHGTSSPIVHTSCRH